MNYKDLAERAAWTFVQSFLAVFVVTDLASTNAAFAAGIAAVLSSLKTVAKNQLSEA